MNQQTNQPMDNPTPDVEVLVKICTQKMPFGKYKGTIIADLPIHYLEWFYRKGMPNGSLGMQLHTIYQIKMNGLTDILFPIKQMVAKEGKR